jgi:hypothetical protein
MSNIIKGLALPVALIALGAAIGNLNAPAHAQMGPSVQGSDALWHLPKFADSGWFIHAHNGRVRTCNMDQASVVGERPGPRCSNWE